MSLVLLDTNIVSYLYKQDTRGLLYAPHLLGNEVAISMMTVAELLQWATLRNWGETRMQQLEATITTRYTLLPIDLDTCRWWATIRAQRSARGLPISPQDAWVAATALQYGVTLITHNPGDFAQILGLHLLSEHP
ncbi:MAG: type II toxin-antitoxin system VapC family toxin [Chloroflexia bacterium]|nr:type II toxin-antitoxin system VapC family toxin [Chloroflexia bacterium]